MTTKLEEAPKETVEPTNRIYHWVCDCKPTHTLCGFEIDEDSRERFQVSRNDLCIVCEGLAYSHMGHLK